MTNPIALSTAALLLCAPVLAHSVEVVIPSGTVVFGELEERITSNERKFRVGYPVDAHVWRDVVVDGHAVIAAGTPMTLRIRKLDGRGAGGEGGSIEIMAVSVKAVDGTEISLTGGYGDEGNDRHGLTRALSFLLWPSAFLPGAKAVLDVGTVFDASIPANTRINMPEGALPTLKLPERPDFTVAIVYDEIDQKGGTLPLEMTLCHRDYTRNASIVAINDEKVRPIIVAINVGKRGTPCHEFRGRVSLEALQKSFKPGINRFTVKMGDEESTVVLNVEM